MAIPKKKSGTKKTVKRKAIVPQPPAPDVPQPPIITDNPTEPSFLSRAWLYIKTHLLLIGLVMLAVIVIILLLRPHKKTDTSRYDELNKAYNEQLRLRSVELERDSLTADYYRYYMY